MNFKQHLQALYFGHRLGFFLGSLLAISLLLIGWTENSLGKTIAYLFAMTSCFVISEFIYFTSKPDFKDWKIKQAKKELLLILATQIIVAALLVYWFLIADQQAVPQAIRISALVLRLLFVFPIFFFFYFLAIRKYTLRELGLFRLDYWFVALPLMVLLGGISYLTYPDGLQFKAVLEENGISAFITLGFLTAAIPEEITRNLLQSRLGKVLKNKSIAWFLASLLWAALHIPTFAFNNENNYYNAAISALGILPIGLLWGYLNQRYRSIIPAVLIHGTNLWGLHNIF